MLPWLTVTFAGRWFCHGKEVWVDSHIEMSVLNVETLVVMLLAPVFEVLCIIEIILPVMSDQLVT